MNETTKEAVQRAEKLLKAVGLPYVIFLPDGTQLGDQDVKRPRPPRSKHVPGTSKTNFRHTGYLEILDKMKVGDVHVFEVEEGMDRVRYRSVLSAAACNRWGKDSTVMAYIANGGIEMLRTA